MNRKRAMLLVCYFNTWVTDPKSKPSWTKQWIDDRIDIFTRYTLSSIKAQTNQDFRLFVLYEDVTEPLVREALDRHPPLPDNVVFTPVSQTREQFCSYIAGSEEMFMTRIDSDDMYHRTMIQQLYDAKPRPDTQVIINQLGYCYDAIGHRIAVWRHTSPPFFTLVYKTQDYIDGKEYEMKGHGGAIKLKHEAINNRYNYVVVIHGKNSLTNFSGSGVITDPAEVDRILREYKEQPI